MLNFLLDLLPDSQLLSLLLRLLPNLLTLPSSGLRYQITLLALTLCNILRWYRKSIFGLGLLACLGARGLGLIGRNGFLGLLRVEAGGW